ncbi:unnamed protein product [Darwinula stevensoni]|uniref:Uncharacterized protein n=1 Tax=Darwinula stevensoni TaxID=69355 RepID=A0A7R8X4H2_9CRUS|nr:unnamed protein product [Darwinula stevensoni]CAG0883538.1 unnamed protein product [Darwinula stevensoni]
MTLDDPRAFRFDFRSELEQVVPGEGPDFSSGNQDETARGLAESIDRVRRVFDPQRPKEEKHSAAQRGTPAVTRSSGGRKMIQEAILLEEVHRTKPATDVDYVTDADREADAENTWSKSLVEFLSGKERVRFASSEHVSLSPTDYAVGRFREEPDKPTGSAFHLKK